MKYYIRPFLLSIIGFTLFSCSDDKAALQSTKSDEPPVLRLITWEDYVAPEVLEAFTEKTGIEVEVDSFENTEELIGILRAYSHRYDLIILDESSVDRFRETRSLRPIDHNRLDGIDNLDPRFLDTACDPGNQYSVPYLWGSTVVAYRNDKITDPEPSFELLFDPSLKGRVLLLDDMWESFAVGLLLEGKSINAYDEASLVSAFERLDPGVRANEIDFVSDAKIREALGSGTAWAALIYSGDAAWVAEDHPEVSYFLPKEGTALWLDSMAISRDAKNLDETYAFINFLLQPEIAAMNANALWYASPNRAAQPLLDEELVSDEALVPPQSVIDRCEFFAPGPPEANAMISKLSRKLRGQGRQIEANTAATNTKNSPAD